MRLADPKRRAEHAADPGLPERGVHEVRRPQVVEHHRLHRLGDPAGDPAAELHAQLAAGLLVAERGPHLERRARHVGEQHGGGIGPELRVQPVEHLGQQVVELQVGERGVGDALEAPRDLCRLARISEQPRRVERECHPAGDVLGDGQLPRAERRPLAVAGEQHHPKHPAPRGERHVHRRAHVELPHDLDVLGAAEPLAQHLLGEIRHDLGQAVDEHAPDERRLGIRRIGTEPLGERSLVGAGVGDGGPLEPAVGTGDVDDDEVCQPRRRHPGDALEPGVRLDGRRQDLAGLDEQLQPPFAIGLLRAPRRARPPRLRPRPRRHRPGGRRRRARGSASRRRAGCRTRPAMLVRRRRARRSGAPGRPALRGSPGPGSSGRSRRRSRCRTAARRRNSRPQPGGPCR